MENSFKKFLAKSIFISAGFIIFVVLSIFFFPKIYLVYNFFTIGLFLVLTNLIYYFSVKSLKGKTITAFTNTFMAASTIKLFVLLIYIIFYVFVEKENKGLFLIFVLVNYIVFSVLEVVSIIKRRKEL